MSVKIGRRGRRGYFQIQRSDVAAIRAVGRDLVFARSAFMAISSIANYDPEATMSYADIAEEAGMSVRKLHDAVKVLVEAGVLEVKSGKYSGTTNEWTVLEGVHDMQTPGMHELQRSSAPGADPITRARETGEIKEEVGEQALLSVDEKPDRLVKRFSDMVVKAHDGDKAFAISSTKPEREAALWMINAVNDDRALLEFLEWLLAHDRYWRSMSLSLKQVKRNWKRSRSQWLGEKNGTVTSGGRERFAPGRFTDVTDY